jgi:O-antigen/teichoic acid export membrane protein
MLLIRGLAVVAMLVAQVIPARCLEIDQFGVFSYITSLLTVLTFVVIWGTDRYSLKSFSLSKSNAEAYKTCKQNTFGVYSVLLINTALVVVFLYFYLPSHLGDNYSVPILFISSVILFGRSIARVSSSVTKGLGNVLTAEFTFSFLRPLLFAIFVTSFYLLYKSISLYQVLVLFSIAYFSVFVITSIKNTTSAGKISKPNFQTIPGVYKSSFFFFLVGVGMPLMANINTIQLGNMSSADDVALYSAAAKIVSIVAVGLVSANLLISPKLSPLYYDGKLSEMYTLIRKNNAFIACITVIPVLIIAFFSEEVLAIFGEKYIEAAPLLRLLVIGQAFNVLCGPVLLVATLIGFQKSASAIVLTMAFLNWLLCILFIPMYGTIGAVYACVIANILLNVGLAVVIYYNTSLDVTMLNLCKKKYAK